MLVLSRKVGEEILIDDEVRVVVLEVRGSQVRLGFVAPKHVPIQRKELLIDLDADSARPASLVG